MTTAAIYITDSHNDLQMHFSCFCCSALRALLLSSLRTNFHGIHLKCSFAVKYIKIFTVHGVYICLVCVYMLFCTSLIHLVFAIDLLAYSDAMTCHLMFRFSITMQYNWKFLTFFLSPRIFLLFAADTQLK